MQNSYKRIQIQSSVHPDIHYKVKIEWPEIGASNRKMYTLQKQLHGLKKQMKLLQHQISELDQDTKQLQDGVMKPYEMQFVHV